MCKTTNNNQSEQRLSVNWGCFHGMSVCGWGGGAVWGESTPLGNTVFITLNAALHGCALCLPGEAPVHTCNLSERLAPEKNYNKKTLHTLRKGGGGDVDYISSSTVCSLLFPGTIKSCCLQIIHRPRILLTVQCHKSKPICFFSVLFLRKSSRGFQTEPLTPNKPDE